MTRRFLRISLKWETKAKRTNCDSGKEKEVYPAKEKTVYQAKRKEEKVARKPAAPRQEIMHRVRADAHTTIDKKEIDERKAK